MVYFTYASFFLIFVVIFSNKVRKKIKKVLISRVFREYLIFICFMMIGASTGVITLFLTGMSVIFATDLGLNPRLAETDILVSNIETIWFLGIYGIIIGSIFWIFQKKLKEKR